MEDLAIGDKKSMVVPRGTPDLKPMLLDMTDIYRAEDRLEEVKVVNPLTAPELRAFFNQTSNTATKYIAWIKYEILQANKNYKLAKAEVILDKSIELFKKYKETGMKYNEDFREAIIAKDPACNELQEKINMLEAAKALLEAKVDTFVRAYFSCDSASKSREGIHGIAASPNHNATPGMLSGGGVNLMGGLSSLDGIDLSKVK
jgi:hypothetical protein